MVKRFQIEMVETALSSCRDEKRPDSVFACFSRPKTDAGQDLERELQNFPAISGLNYRVGTCLSFVGRSLRSPCPTISLIEMRDVRMQEVAESIAFP